MTPTADLAIDNAPEPRATRSMEGKGRIIGPNFNRSPEKGLNARVDETTREQAAPEPSGSGDLGPEK